MSLLDGLAQGATVVTANNRLARHLRWRFDRAQAKAGHAAWASPDILPWHAWLERLYELSVLAGGNAGGADLLTPQQAGIVWQGVMESGTDVIGRAAGIVVDAWQTRCAWRISNAELREAARSPDTDAFAAWAGAFDDTCRERGWVDPWTLPELLHDDLLARRIGVDAPVLFAGFDAPTAQQLRMIDGAGGERVASGTAGQASVRRVGCADPLAEIDVAARWARAALERTPGGVIGVVVPGLAQRGAAVRRSFLNILCPDWRSRPVRDLPVNDGRGVPLTANGLVHIALLILQLVERRLDYRDLGQLLRSPYLAGGIDESSGRSALDVKLREEGRMSIDLRWIVKARGHAELAPGFVKLIQNALSWADRATGSAEPSGWAAKFTELLGIMGWPEGRALSDHERRAHKAWLKLFDGFASTSRVVGAMNRGAARRLLARMARERIFQLDERASGVQIMSPDAALGHDFDALWVCGMSSDAWPPAARPNPLIPLDLQRRAGVPDATPQTYRANALASMERLWASAPVVCVSWARASGQGELVRSPALDSVADLDVDSIDTYTGETQLGNLFRNRCAMIVDRDPAPPLQKGEVTRGGSRLMKLQGACPARAFFEFRLGAQEMPMPVYGIDARERGNIIHDALESLFTEIAARGGVAKMPGEQIEELIDASADQSLQSRIAGRDAFGRALLKSEKMRLRQLLVALIELDRRRPPYVTVGTELTEEVTVGPLHLRLRQDRVDLLGESESDGAQLVIDYKTGARFSISAWAGERPAEPQLPLYAATGAASAICVILLNQEGVAYKGVGAENFGLQWMEIPGKVAEDKSADWAALKSTWQNSFERLAEEFAAGDVRIDAGNTKQAEGEYAMLTRISERYSEDGA